MADEWKKCLKEKACEIYKTKWPQRFKDLNQELQEIQKLQNSPDNMVLLKKAGKRTVEKVVIGVKRKAIENGNGDNQEGNTVEIEQSQNPYIPNTMILSNFKKMLSKIQEFVEELQEVKMWITLNVPKIEDGNNFGVSIQEEVLSELKGSEAGFEDMMN